MAARAPLVMPRAAARSGPLPAAAAVAPRQSAQCLRARGAVGGLFFDQRTARPVRHLLPDAKLGAIGREHRGGRAGGGARAEAAGVEVFDLNGKAVPIVDLWKERKAVVAFARHFGCVLCRKRADLLAAKQDVMQAAGVALVLIGPGSVEQAKAFCEQTKFKEVYADPTHSSYDALEFAFGLFSTFTPAAGLKIIQLYREGYRQDWELSFEKNTRTRGGWYQGGLIVAGDIVSARLSTNFLDDVSCMLGCTRSSLHVVASENGVVVGRLIFADDGDRIDCTRMGVGGKAIPPNVDRVSGIESDALFILLVEKDAAFMRLTEDRFYNRFSCIILTAKGQPDVATRLFLRRLKVELKLPVLALVDSDPYGLKILSVYMCGSKNMSYDSANLTTPDIKWLGVRPSDLDKAYYFRVDMEMG
ncbi:unnamed protein product [Miscanthus lutarioriparius]|uniref:Uncharacterized protein n=1 Tax=Miscanthus lutarioriparius TaxID=422564 RepID=A0A811MSF1_9POAL|nr:unnamed protein product [Miscanthus lutarioriparius]